MANRKRHRLLGDLYNVTNTLSQPQTTPILQGNFRMQGPANESDRNIHTNMMLFPVEKEYISCSKNSKYHCRLQSGTCNVCSAPCSSCLHINQFHMGSKVDEFSGEASSENALSFSVNEAVPISKTWTKDFVSGSSSNNLENVDCEASGRNSNLSATSGSVNVFPKLEDFEVQGDHRDHQSCVTGIADAKLSHLSSSDGDNTEFSPLPVSAQGNVSSGYLQTFSECLDVRCNLNESQKSSKRQRRLSKQTMKELPLSDSVCSSAALSSPNAGLLETPSDTAGDAIDRLNSEGDLSHQVIDKSPSDDPSPEVLRENLSPRLCGEFLNVISGHVSTLSGETTSGNKNSNPPEDPMEIVENNDGIDNADLCYDKESCLKSDPMKNDSGDNAGLRLSNVKGGSLGSHPMKNEGGDIAVLSLSNGKESSLESHPMDECDDSDLVEHDVKVCDICGDAGREDLLAICCRCSDGAEHTYCMRERMDKVPLGDWLCEECKFDAQMKDQNQEIVGIVDGSEKINFSGQANPESINVCKKFEAKVSDVDENRIPDDSPPVKILGKRLLDDVQVSCPAKRHFVEPDNGSANMSISSGVPALSRNSSLKLERLKTKTNQHSFNSSVAAPESASASRTQGTFIKSNSFNSLNVKPKVNLLDDVIPQKHRSVSKSVSFKSPNMGRQNVGESKVKMLSPKISHIQDTKGSKHSKDHNIFDRRNSFQLERLPTPNSSSLVTKTDKKLASPCETNPLYSSRKVRDAKAVSSDGRSRLLSRPSVCQGEVKKQSNLIGVSSTNGDKNHALKPNQDSSKVDTSSSNSSGERPPSNANEGLLDGSSLQNESINFVERAKDTNSIRSKQSSMGSGRTVTCQTCKEIGHSAQSCPDNDPGSPFDVTASRLPREGADSKDKLKAAIEAAVLRKPGIYRKHRRPDQCNDGSAPNVKCEMAGQVLLSDSTNRGNASISHEIKEEKMVIGSFSADFCKQDTVDNDIKQFPAPSSRTEDSCPFVPLEGQSMERDVARRVSEGTSTFFKRLAIPDNDYMWKGVFEVHRDGGTINLFDGIQAHLSACASPKVLEAVKKFNHKVLVNEVPRLTTWPVQFQENGVREDNVAIFFFAKDSASYEKSYKGLLDNMMKNDVALKGNFDGFELMIFPSNQLPEKSQRWNTLFFMWGVFRGKRVNQQHLRGSDEENIVPQGSIPFARMCSSMKISSDANEDRGVSTAGCAGSVASEVRGLSSSEAPKEGGDGRVSSDIINNDLVLTEQPFDSRQHLRSFPVVQSSIAQSCGEAVDVSNELRHLSISLEEKCHVGSYDKREPEVKVCGESAVIGCDFNESQQKPINCNRDLSRQHSAAAAGAHEMGSVHDIGEGSSSDGINNRKYEASLKCELVHESPSGTGNQMVNDRYAKVDSNGTSETEAGIATEDIGIEEVGGKQKSNCYDGLYKPNVETRSWKGSSLQIRQVDSGSLTRADGDGVNAERHFFPVDALAEEEVGGARSKKSSAEEDTSPNLELALGAETKTMAQSIPLFFGAKEEAKMSWKFSSPEKAASKVGGGGEEDDVSASLSLSLSFPFPAAVAEKEQQRVKALSKAEKELKGEEGNVNTSLLIFGVEGQQIENRRRHSLQPGRNMSGWQGM